jgi:quercetin dioxygenase-like cupin family protein
MESLKAALESVLQEGQEYRLLMRSFPSGKLVIKHSHPEANEWIIANQGSFQLVIENEILNYNLDGSKYLIIHVPKGVSHSLETVSDLTYFVLRDGPGGEELTV